MKEGKKPLVFNVNIEEPVFGDDFGRGMSAWAAIVGAALRWLGAPESFQVLLREAAFKLGDYRGKGDRSLIVKFVGAKTMSVVDDCCELLAEAIQTLPPPELVGAEWKPTERDLARRKEEEAEGEEEPTGPAPDFRAPDERFHIGFKAGLMVMGYAMRLATGAGIEDMKEVFSDLDSIVNAKVLHPKFGGRAEITEDMVEGAPTVLDLLAAESPEDRHIGEESIVETVKRLRQFQRQTAERMAFMQRPPKDEKPN